MSGWGDWRLVQQFKVRSNSLSLGTRARSRPPGAGNAHTFNRLQWRQPRDSGEHGLEVEIGTHNIGRERLKSWEWILRTTREEGPGAESRVFTLDRQPEWEEPASSRGG